MDENKRLQMDFMEVCSMGDLEKAKVMLDGGKIDTNFQHFTNGWTALHWAARRNHQHIVEFLLQNGFDPKTQAKDGKIPFDLAIDEAVKKILTKAVDMNGANELAHTSPTSEKHEIYSYGRRGSFKRRTRFLLVRTRFGNGKESFKRVTFPSHGSIDTLKIIIEKAMKKGKVLEVISLPDGIKIETEQQIQELADCQRVDVVFESPLQMESVLKPSLDRPGLPPLFSSKKEVLNQSSKPLEKPVIFGQSGKDILSLSDDNSTGTVHSDYIVTTASLESVSENSSVLPMPETVATTECLFAAKSSVWAAVETTLLEKFSTRNEKITLQAEASKSVCSGIQMLHKDEEENSESLNAGFELDASIAMIPSALSQEVCKVTKSNGLPAFLVDDESCESSENDMDHNVLGKMSSHEQTLKMIVLVSSIVGFGSLAAYLISKKLW